MFYLRKLSTKSGASAVGEVEQVERISESEQFRSERAIWYWRRVLDKQPASISVSEWKRKDFGNQYQIKPEKLFNSFTSQENSFKHHEWPRTNYFSINYNKFKGVPSYIILFLHWLHKYFPPARFENELTKFH